MIGILGDRQCVGEQVRYTCENIPIDTLARVLRAIPVIIPPIGDRLDIGAILERVDGLMLPGGLSNVHPRFYGGSEDSSPGPFDEARDATAIPLIRAAISGGVPLLLTCRGFQELVVALGGSLEEEPQDRPSEDRHGTPPADTDDERYRIRQAITLRSDGMLAACAGTAEAKVNSLHSMIIRQLPERLLVEAAAEDGTIEAAAVEGAPGFVLGVMFHPEYWAERDDTSLAILRRFADAVHAYRDQVRSRRQVTWPSSDSASKKNTSSSIVEANG